MSGVRLGKARLLVVPGTVGCPAFVSGTMEWTGTPLSVTGRIARLWAARRRQARCSPGGRGRGRARLGRRAAGSSTSAGPAPSDSRRRADRTCHCRAHHDGQVFREGRRRTVLCIWPFRVLFGAGCLGRHHQRLGGQIPALIRARGRRLCRVCGRWLPSPRAAGSSALCPCLTGWCVVLRDGQVAADTGSALAAGIPAADYSVARSRRVRAERRAPGGLAGGRHRER